MKRLAVECSVDPDSRRSSGTDRELPAIDTARLTPTGKSMRERYVQLLIAALCMLLAAAPVLGAGVKVHVDYAGGAVFGDYRTFLFRNTRWDLRRASPSLHETVLRQLIGYARQGGLALVPSEPDVYLAYYAAFDGELELVPEALEYEYGEGFQLSSYWGTDGTHDGETRSFTLPEGTVMVDLWDRRQRKLVWRGTATGALDRDEVRLARALKKLMERWDAMYIDQAREVRKLESSRQR